MPTIKCKEYEIVFTENVLKEVEKVAKKYDEVIVITDKNVFSIYEDVLPYKAIVLDAVEKNKSLDMCKHIYECLINFNCSRNTLLISMGGGITSDITGFVAGTYMRGIDYINIPTTLLSMVDSSVGGKVGVNFLDYKNYVGLFNNPKKVIICKNFIDSLGDHLVKDGIAEMMKIFMLLDESSLHSLKLVDFKELIERAVGLKVSIVEADFKDNAVRKLLNFGHTIGHAIETHSNNKVSHGEAVAIGIYTQISDNLRKEVDSIYDKFDLPKTYPHLKEALELINTDKKANKDEIDEIVITSIGSSKIKKMTIKEFKDSLNV